MDDITLLHTGNWTALFERWNRYVLACVDYDADLGQEVWIRVVINQDKFTYGQFSKWISTLANCVKLDTYRKKNNRSKSGSMKYERITEYPMDSNYISKEFGDKEDDFITSKAEKEELEYRLKLVCDALDQLPEKQRDVVILRSCKTFAEISDLMAESVNTTLGRMRYAKKHLQLILKNQTKAA